MLVKTYSAALQSIHATLITVELHRSPGTRFSMVGLPDTAVRESWDRVKSACATLEYKCPVKNTVYNLSPGDIRKEGTVFDLPMSIALLADAGHLPVEPLSDYLIAGELSLDGTLQPIKGALPMAIMAREQGFKGFILPKANEFEAAVVNQLDVYGMDNLHQVVEFLNGRGAITPTEVDTRALFASQAELYDCDFSEVKGQEQVIRAFEVAAAGGHNILMIGAPGSGKSMMAKRVPTILPPLSLAESLETTQIYSVAGELPNGTTLMKQRPFRSPHHTISNVALVGGGSNPRPGEISLAHNGVLFLDEMAEFNKNALELMRQPLEDRLINISRAKANATYPASFMLVAAMNPCPCGYYNDPTHKCVCPAGAPIKYLRKLSGPLMDRIDIQLETRPVPVDKLSQQRGGEPSERIRERVIRARAIQTERFRDEPNVHCNAQMTSALMKRHAQPTEAARDMLAAALKKLDLSARAYDRILKVSRTIADLDGSETIDVRHISEAITYRNLDRTSWGE